MIDEAFDMEEARKKWKQKFDTKKSPRKKRHQKLTDSVDRRSLRATGRTEQFNFRCSEGLKRRAQKAAKSEGITLARWMERLVEVGLAECEAKVEGG